MGWVNGHYTRKDARNSYYPGFHQLENLHHAWVEEGGAVYDSTPFEYGLGNSGMLPTELPHELVEEPEYIVKEIIPEAHLMEPLTYFPGMRTIQKFA